MLCASVTQGPLNCNASYSEHDSLIGKELSDPKYHNAKAVNPSLLWTFLVWEWMKTELVYKHMIHPCCLLITARESPKVTTQCFPFPFVKRQH